MGTFGDYRASHGATIGNEPNAGVTAGEQPMNQQRAPEHETRPRPARGPVGGRRGVPVVCLLAGLLLATTHDISGGDEIRRSDAPRLVDLVRETQQSVDRLTAQRDQLATEVDNHHGGSPGALAALTAIQHRNEALAADAGLDPIRGPGLVVT